MSVGFNVFGMLSAMGSSPKSFRDLKQELTKIVPTLFEKQFKAIGGDLERLQQLRQALGDDLFEQITETMDPKKVIGFLKSLDKHRPELKAAPTPTWAAAHLQALGRGDVEPASAPPKAAGRRAPKKASPQGQTKLSNADLVGTGKLQAMGGQRATG